MRIEPLQRREKVFSIEFNFQNHDALTTEMEESSYDFNPFPYCPIWVDSGERLLDFPNWITWVASPNMNFQSHKLAEKLWNTRKSELKC